MTDQDVARQRVGIIGGGTMGSGIAELCLATGHEVFLHDVDERSRARASATIAAGLARAVARGRLQATSAAAADRLHLAASAADVAMTADIVIEAAVEDLEVKRGIFAILDEAAGVDVPLATNTSALSVASIAEATRHPERVLGLHFFNPAPRMALVELVVGPRTDSRVLEHARRFAEALGKFVVPSADSPGFIVNRVARPFSMEAIRMLEAGEASAGRIDHALEDAGYPMGPFRLMDLIGLDIELAIDRALDDAFRGSTRFRPPRRLADLVAEGRLGRKTGSGFHERGQDGRAAAEASEPGDAGAAAIVERLELAMINEAYRCVAEGVAVPSDVDLAMRRGAGHPRGPFELAGSLGLRTVVERLHALNLTQRERSGDQFEVAALLWQMATV